VSTPSAIVECVIRNLSDTGALLEFSATVTLPDTFKLIIKPEIITRNCKVARRSAQRIGVEFV
jgi:hypothetical protein